MGKQSTILHKIIIKKIILFSNTNLFIINLEIEQATA